MAANKDYGYYGNASQKPCDTKPKKDHQSAQRMILEDFRVAVIVQGGPNGYISEGSEHIPVG